MEFNKDTYAYRVQVFGPAKGTTLPTSYTPKYDEVVMLGNDVDLTLDGITLTYVEGSVLGLAKGITYSFSVETPVHKM